MQNAWLETSRSVHHIRDTETCFRATVEITSLVFEPNAPVSPTSSESSHHEVRHARIPRAVHAGTESTHRAIPETRVRAADRGRRRQGSVHGEAAGRP